jgi:hypothetical protein
VTLHRFGEIDAPALERLVREAVRVARLPRSERVALAMDRELREELAIHAR